MSALTARLTNISDRRESRVPMSLRTRWANIREDRTPIIQLSVGAGIAWLVAHDIVGHTQPFFAPIAAILIVVVGATQRRRTAFELVLGVSVGILIGELLIIVIGRGGWQITIVVGLAVLVSTFLGLRGFARNQSATSAALIAAIGPVAGASNPA
ncbi:MAG: FUSC family protein, partial [Nocardioidaceae bacterium]